MSQETRNGGIGDLWHSEPAAITGAVGALLGLAIAFGAPITSEQKLQILETVTILFPLLAAWIVRRKSVPVRTLEKAGLDPAEVKEVAADPERSYPAP